MAEGKNSIAPSTIRALVTRFEDQRDSYAHPSYKEAQLRKEFIDPMWNALGWDMDNTQGYAEQYKEVIHEDAIKLSSSVYSKAPDYCFRIGGVRKFFLEAKKPSVDIAGDPEPAFQLRSYAWSEKLPLSVLTDFEELSVYDTRIKPSATDKASAARIMAIRFTDYVEKWDEIAGIFSKEAVLKGSFDKYAETAKKKRGTTTVDEDFLEQIEAWRDELARNIATRNQDLSQAELNFAVQVTIDRIVFLRICEDRGIEEYQTLLGTTNGTSIYPRIVELFRRADQKYNSGLFHFSHEKGRSAAPDSLTPRLDIDDAVLKKILRSLYYPESPYVFSALPADILGQVYEQFLGKVIRLTAGHQAKVEEKPEVKKAGGVYYTPTYIVDYIVKHTVGPLLEGRTPKQVAGGKEGPIRILDPACGSGTFLLQAYQYMLDWYRDAYVAEGSEKHTKGKSPVLYKGASGELRLTTGERKRILLTHIFGVDIDYQAVEVTKLSLLLKVLEGESDQTLQRTLQLFQERALPDLDENIKHGDSLVEDSGNQELLLTPVGDANAPLFDWVGEFCQVFLSATSGFDVVLGNPPYNKVSGKTESANLSYFKSHYSVAQFKTELYALFAERSLRLLRRGGFHGFIVPNSFLSGVHLKSLRELLASKNSLIEAVLLENVKVFAKAKLDSVVYIVRKGPPGAQSTFMLRAAGKDLQSTPLGEQSVLVSKWRQTPELAFRVTAGRLAPEIARAVLHKCVPLKDVASVHLGLVLESNELLHHQRSAAAPDAILLGRDLSRYGPIQPNAWFSYETDPIVGGTKKADVYCTTPRLLFQAIRNLKLPRRLVGTLTREKVFAMGTIHNVIVRREEIPSELLLGILNSTIMNAYYAANFPEHRIKGAYLESLPIRLPAGETEEAIGARIVELVRARLSCEIEVAGSRSSISRNAALKKSLSLDRAIDERVCELYEIDPSLVELTVGSSGDSEHSNS